MMIITLTLCANKGYFHPHPKCPSSFSYAELDIVTLGCGAPSAGRDHVLGPPPQPPAASRPHGAVCR